MTNQTPKTPKNYTQTKLFIAILVGIMIGQYVQVGLRSDARASEATIRENRIVEPAAIHNEIDSKAVAVPQDLEPIKIELTDSEKAGLAKCLKVKAKDYCNDLFN